MSCQFIRQTVDHVIRQCNYIAAKKPKATNKLLFVLFVDVTLGPTGTLETKANLIDHRAKTKQKENYIQNTKQHHIFSSFSL